MGFNISRYQSRIQREFEVEVVTPMFLGGANLSEAELRTPSLKGMIRFWWRATCGIDDIQKLKNKEGKIFGDTSQKAHFSVHIENIYNVKPVSINLPKGQTFPVKKFKVGIIDYLSFGLRDTKKYLRQHYPSGTKFSVNFTFSGEKIEAEVLKAFRSLAHFGGLGAKSRNGFGSLALNDESKPAISMMGPLKLFSSASEDSDFFLTEKSNYSKWEDALSAIGMAYKDARLSLKPDRSYQKRLLLAKPIVQAKGNSNERHAKPYFLHVGKTSTGYYGQILFMPYRYLSGSKAFSEDILRQYQESCKQMNKIIKEKLSGGAK
ncbi:MAG: type III-B CRISPR module RAMP protein Cmr1 [Thermodesulfobacteriota bacterium]